MRLGGRFGRGGMGRGGGSKPGGILFFFCSFSFSVTVSGVVAAGRALGSRWRVFRSRLRAFRSRDRALGSRLRARR